MWMALGKVRDFHQILSKLKTFLDSKKCDEIYVRAAKLIWRQWCNTKLGNLLWLNWFCWPNVFKSFLCMFTVSFAKICNAVVMLHIFSHSVSLWTYTHIVWLNRRQLNGCQLIANVIFTDFHRFSPLVCLHCVPCAERASTEYSGINDTTSVYIDWKLVYLLAQITIIPLAFDRIIDVLHVALIVDETFGIIEKIACAPNAHSMVNMHRTCHQLQLSSIPRCQPLNKHTSTYTARKKRSKKVVTDLDAARMGITGTEYGIKYAYFMN